jgi:hypothetical protein
VADEEVVIICTRCGKILEELLLHDDCRPRFLYWWPREHPYVLMLLGLALGIILGWLTPW